MTVTPRDSCVTRVPDTGARLKTVLGTYREAGGRDACLVLHNAEDGRALVQSLGTGAAHIRSVGHSSFALDVTRPGEFLVRVAFTPYWSIERGNGCLIRHGEWTLARASHPGIFRVAADFSLSRAWNAVTGARKTC